MKAFDCERKKTKKHLTAYTMECTIKVRIKLLTVIFAVVRLIFTFPKILSLIYVRR